MACAIVWFRRDLRLDDNPALAAAVAAGYQPIPAYIHAPDEEAPWVPGAASRVWLARSLRALDADLRARGSQLLVLSGESGTQLQSLIDASGAVAVYWNRLYEPACIARDRLIKSALRKRGISVSSHNAALLIEPWDVATQKGDPYRVFTPFWRAARSRLPLQFDLAPAPTVLPSVPFVFGHAIEALGLTAQPRWDEAFWLHWQPGEAGAQEALGVFLDDAVRGYAAQRDIPSRVGTSRLSPHLHFGEISPRQIWNALAAATLPAHCDAHVAQYRNELGWREFSHHLLFHYPHIPECNLDSRFERFAWAAPDPARLKAWQTGRTGVPLVDAGMRELWHTGWMHNRVRMVVASFLCKNLRMHWQHGARWFWDTLVDADLAANTQGWQWSAGTGADAAPYFRIFSPASQAARFDPDGCYIRRWCPELAALPERALHAPWLHRERIAELAPSYPAPIVDVSASRDAALAAWQAMRALTPTEPA